MTTENNNRINTFLDKLAAKSREVGNAILTIGIGASAVALFFGYRAFRMLPADYAAIALGCVIFGAASAILGAWSRSESAARLSGRDAARIKVLIVGGALGLALTAASLWQGYFWWDDIVSGIRTWKGDHSGRVWLLAILVFAGLVIMFASLLLARSEENTSPTLRRLLYGYNAILSSFLLLGILIVVNILSSAYLSKRTDWTGARIFTLSPQAENVLNGLDKPVKVIVIGLQQGDRLDLEIHDLLDNVHATTNKVQVEYLIRDLNIRRVAQLKKEYKLEDDLGMLVVYGSGSDEGSTFIPERDFFQAKSTDPRTRQEAEPVFRGEDLLISAINFLQEGKKKPIIYFTQGNGELELSATGQRVTPAHRADQLRSRLEKGNYVVQGLDLNEKAPTRPDVIHSATVPDDAAVVVIAGPQRPFAANVLEALRKYMSEPHKDPADPNKQRKGKLMVLLDVVPGEGGHMADLGLEKFLAEFDVQVTNERVLAWVDPGRRALTRPEQVPVITNPDLRGHNPLATLFTTRDGRVIQIPMRNVRQIKPGSPPEGGAPTRYRSEMLLMTAPNIWGGPPVWAETSMSDGMQLLSEYDKQGDEFEKRLTGSLPVGVSVSDPAAPNPSDPHAGMFDSGTPRALVIGNATFASDEMINRQTGDITFDFFHSALAWLREKPNSIGIAPKDRGSYQMKEDVALGRMIFMPLMLMSVAVIGLGLGVWVARRR